MIDFLKDLWGYLKTHRKYYLVPLILVLVLLGGIIVFAEGSVVAPFIYTVF